MKKGLLIAFPLILLILVNSCTTREYVAVEEEYPRLPEIEDIISKDMLISIHKPLDLIPEPQTVNDILYNMSEFRTGYINWRNYATALEEYYNEIAMIFNSSKEE